MSASNRAKLHLEASLAVHPVAVLQNVRVAAQQVKGGGASLLTTGLQNIGAQVNVEREAHDRLVLSITSGKRLVELCTFSAVVRPDGQNTALCVGGLETYRTTQSTMLGFIPVGPKMIAGYAPYKRFLEAVAAHLQGLSADATVRIVGA